MLLGSTIVLSLFVFELSCSMMFICQADLSFVQSFQPVPGAGPVSIVAAAQLMMKEVLVAEAKGRPTRINTLALMTAIVTRSRPSGRPEWLTADEVGEYCVHLAATEVNGATVQLKDRAQVETMRG